jgi:hypothetical protein
MMKNNLGRLELIQTEKGIILFFVSWIVQLLLGSADNRFYCRTEFSV